MKRFAYLLTVIGMITAGPASAQDVKYDPNKYEVVSDVTRKSQTESNTGDAGSNVSKKTSSGTSVKKKPPKPKANPSSKKTSTGSVSSYRTQKSVRSSEAVRTIVLKEKDTPKPKEQPLIYNDHRQYHYTVNNYGSSNDGVTDMVTGVVWDTGQGLSSLAPPKDTCHWKKHWTKEKWKKPMTKFKVYTSEVYSNDEQVSYKTDTSWKWPMFKTRTWWVYEKHYRGNCGDTIARYDTVKRWWVPVRRYGGIALLAGGGVLLADYACKNQYWGLFASNDKGGNNPTPTPNPNPSGDPTGYPTHKPGPGNKPSGEREDVLPVKEQTKISLAKKQLPAQYAPKIEAKKYEPQLYLTANFAIPLFTGKTVIKFTGAKLTFL